jgi:adenosylcobinamide kinase/adenosylcobinamide-phosphate guanylyltransferase
MKIFISGGCKNGKSCYAQRLAQAQGVAQRVAKRTGSLYYIATMKPVDPEDDERILRHRCDREGWGFTTIEQPVDIEHILDKCDRNHSFLLDSLTALLANEMFLPDGNVNEQAVKKITNGLRQITDNINNIVIVSDNIYSDAFLYDPLTTQYRKSLAEIDRAVAGSCDVVLEAVYTNLIVHKGTEMFGGVYEKIF